MELVLTARVGQAIEVDSPLESDDGDLVLAAQSGSAEALEEIVRKYWPDAHRLAGLIVRDERAAEDIAQEAMLAAVRSLGRFDSTRPLRPWIATIATNKALDWTRRKARRPEAPLVSAPVPSGEMADGASADLVIALEALDPQTRAIVVLRYVLDFRAHEIGSAMGLRPATVRTKLARALTRLRESIEEEA